MEDQECLQHFIDVAAYIPQLVCAKIGAAVSDREKLLYANCIPELSHTVR